jgi:protein TonB
MLHLINNLFTKGWLDVVFEKRNHDYGAYELRNHNSSTTVKALLLSSTFYVFLFLAPGLIDRFRDHSPIEQIVKIVDVTVQPPPLVDKKKVADPIVMHSSEKRNAAQASRPRNNQVMFPPPIVKPDEQVHDTPPQIEDLKNADPGQATISGDPGADIVVTGPVGTGTDHGENVAVEDSKIYEFSSLESVPQFPGGMNKFYEYLRTTVKYPEMARENNIQGKVFVSFVVEKNGELTDVRVEHRVGGGLDEEAVSVLKRSPRWIAGIQNGHPVRVKYNIPLNFTLAQ